MAVFVCGYSAGATPTVGWTKVPFPDGCKIVSVLAFGWSSLLAVSHSGEIYVWGFDGVEGRPIPTPQIAALPSGVAVQKAAGSTDRVALLTRSGDILVSSRDSLFLFRDVQLSGLRATDVACGEKAVYFLCEHRLYSAPLANNEDHREGPTMVPGLDGLRLEKVFCSAQSVFVVTSIGELWAFGWNSYGQLGLGSVEDSPRPRLVEHVQTVKLRIVASGHWQTLALDELGAVYSWGIGLVRDGTSTVGREVVRCQKIQGTAEPRMMEEFDVDTTLVEAACGSRHCAVISDDGNLWTWGWNKYGQLGNGDASDTVALTPIPISGLPPVVGVSCGDWNTLIVTASDAG